MELEEPICHEVARWKNVGALRQLDRLSILRASAIIDAAEKQSSKTLQIRVRDRRRRFFNGPCTENDTESPFYCHMRT